MKSLHSCSDVELQRRCTWSIRLTLLLLTVIAIGYGLAFVQSFDLSGSDYVALWALLLGLGYLSLPCFGYYALASGERSRRKVVKGLVEIIEAINPEPHVR